MGDFFGAEATNQTQRQCDLGVRCQCRVATSEDQPQLIIVHIMLLGRFLLA
jgi:hypothetical protein